MSEPIPPSEHPRHPERVAGLFVAVGWAALVFAVFGVLAVVLDRDPVEQRVSPYFGLAAIVLSLAVVYLGILFTVPRRRPWLGALATAAGVYLVILVAAFVVDTALTLEQVASPFVLAAVLIALVPPIACWAWFRRAAVGGDERR
jgi:hypothetical protein